MTPEEQVRVQASIAELVRQRDAALGTCANLAADVAALKAKLDEIEMEKKAATQVPAAELAVIK